ncbi:MAG: endo alpha-1,4 polygalactosaminidase [Treponema sp.]|nr:endo alpha-1,4 polygalactosaminidase [Treponema sp.]
MRRGLLLALLAGLCSAAIGQVAAADPGYRDSMRRLVIDLSAYAKARRSGFQVLTQNGNALFEAPMDTALKKKYLASIDGVGQESLRFGDPAYGDRTPSETTDYALPILRFLKAQGKVVLVVEYCDEPDQISEAFAADSRDKFLSFAAPTRTLDGIPSPLAGATAFSASPVETLAQAKNFLYLIDPEGFGSKEAFVSAVAGTDYDLVVIDALFDGEFLTSSDLARLRHKSAGARRLVLAYLSIGEAEDYRPYWRQEWNRHPPSWIESENPRWKGNFRVRYWEPAWRAILFGSPSSYLDRILAAGFDGVYLDTVDTFVHFEELAGKGD